MSSAPFVQSVLRNVAVGVALKEDMQRLLLSAAYRCREASHLASSNVLAGGLTQTKKEWENMLGKIKENKVLFLPSEN